MPRIRMSSFGAMLVKTAWVYAAVLGTGLVASSALAASGHDKGSLAGPHSSQSSLGRSSGARDLDISVVDLTAAAEAQFDDLELDLSPLSTDPDSTAPMLYLAPRVATLVRDVFGDESNDDTSELIETSVDSLPEVSIAPLADSSEILKPANPGIDENSDGTEAKDLPYSSIRIYREMYRTDI